MRDFYRLSYFILVTMIFYSIDAYQKIHELVKNLGPSNQYIVFDTGLSDEQLAFLKSLRIQTSRTLNNFNDFNRLASQIKLFFIALGNSDADSDNATIMLIELIHKMITDSGKESAWVCLRAWNPVNLYEIPRWHYDGYYYKPVEDYCYKIVFTLQGEGTLFVQTDSFLRTEFLKIQNQTFTDQVGKIIPNLPHLERQRRTYATRLATAALFEHQSILKLEQGQAGIFIVGDELLGAIHSEPSIYENRLFISVVPGTQEQINQLYKRWHFMQ